MADRSRSITKKKIAERPAAAGAAASRLADLQADFDGKADLVSRLKDAATKAQGAVAANDAAWSAWGKERSEEIVAKGRLRLELERTHRALGARFPGQKEFVESFFLKGERPSEGGGEEDEPAPAPPAPPTP